ncbi:hypothetical protein ACJQWK_00418 [Exserohilum turcicum]
MARQDVSTRSVWTDLWHDGMLDELLSQWYLQLTCGAPDPVLYIALTCTSTINNALMSLLVLAILSTLYETFCIWLGRRACQPYNYRMINGATERPKTSVLATLARCNRTSPPTLVVAKAAFHSLLFLLTQYMITSLVIHVARAMVPMWVTHRNVRRRCSRLRDRGLECAAAQRYHTPLHMAAAVILLCIIRGLELHIDVPSDGLQHSNHSAGFLRLRAKCRGILQTVLAAPITLVSLYTGVSRGHIWARFKLLLVQALVSLAVFVAGNVVCLVAALPVSHLFAA